MDELQLKLCDIQGRLFELSADKNYGSAVFIKQFMTSSIAKALDSTYNRMQWVGEEYLLEEITDASNGKITSCGEVFPKDVLHWIGYTYRYWHYYTGEESSKIYKQAPVDVMKRNYTMLHTMSSSLAVDALKEIYRQKSEKKSSK